MSSDREFAQAMVDATARSGKEKHRKIASHHEICALLWEAYDERLDHHSDRHCDSEVCVCGLAEFKSRVWRALVSEGWSR